MRNLAVIFVTLFVVSTLISIPAVSQVQAVGPLEKRALVMAIQHFDAERTKSLKIGSNEYEYMLRLLGSISEKEPGLKKYLGIDWQPETHRDPLQAVGAMLFVADQPSSSDNIAAKYAMRTLGEIVKGCSSEQSNIAKGVEITYSLSATCTNTVLVGELIKLGIKTVWVKNIREEEYKWNQVNLSFEIDSSTKQDMTQVLEKMQSMEDLRDLTTSLQIPPDFGYGLSLRSSPITLGYGDTGFFFKAEKPASFDDRIQIVYNLGWGDCMAGCTSNHIWDVSVMPSLKEGKYTFEVTISQSGDPLPRD